MPTHRSPAASSEIPRTHLQNVPPDDALLRATLWLMGFGQPVAEVDGQALNAFVRHHGVAGLLDRTRVEALDRTHSTALTQEQRRIALRALQLGATLQNLIPAMTARGLQPLALKGPALAVQAHGALSTRGGVDLDILLSEEQWPAALEVLQQQGYTPAPGQRLPLARGTHELVLLHRERRPRVELHRRLLRHRHLIADTQGMAQEVDLQGTQVASLDPIHALPYLIAHANQHCFRRLIWLMDIHALLQRPDLDMQRVAREIQRTGTCAMLDTCLTLLDTLFGTPVAAPLQRVRRPCRASHIMAALALEAIRESLSDDEVAQRLGPLKRVSMDIALQDSLSGRLHALSGWLSPTDKDSNWMTLPPALSFLYPLIRLYRLARRFR